MASSHEADGGTIYISMVSGQFLLSSMRRFCIQWPVSILYRASMISAVGIIFVNFANWNIVSSAYNCRHRLILILQPNETICRRHFGRAHYHGQEPSCGGPHRYAAIYRRQYKWRTIVITSASVISGMPISTRLPNFFSGDAIAALREICACTLAAR